MDEKVYQVALGLIPGVGDVLSKNLISYTGAASAIFKSSNSKLRKIPGIGPKVIEAIVPDPYLQEAEQLIQSATKSGIRILHYTDKDYPQRLRQHPDCPNIIYLKGNGEVNPGRTVAIVGTRNATEYGKDITDKIVEEFRDLNVTVISGLAYGIDIQAHRASLNNKVATWAVLGGGINKIYPSVHKKTAIELQESGFLISEIPPDVQADSHHFPARNRIIAALSDAIIVVEAAEKGGALITANIADSYNKTVFAIPGNLKNKYSEGCNYLIRNQKANIYTGVSDLMYHLNWDKPEDSFSQKPAFDFASLTNEERIVCNLLAENRTGIEIDQLAWKSQISPNKLASILLTLEFSGVVKSLPGKRFQLR